MPWEVVEGSAKYLCRDYQNGQRFSRSPLEPRVRTKVNWIQWYGYDSNGSCKTGNKDQLSHDHGLHRSLL